MYISSAFFSLYSVRYTAILYISGYIIHHVHNLFLFMFISYMMLKIDGACSKMIASYGGKPINI